MLSKNSSNALPHMLPHPHWFRLPRLSQTDIWILSEPNQNHIRVLTWFGQNSDFVFEIDKLENSEKFFIFSIPSIFQNFQILIFPQSTNL